MNNIKYVGMDVHKAITVIAVLNQQGQVESLTKIKTKADNFRDYFRGLSGTTQVVLEEGGWSTWLYQLLKPLVSSVTVCETRHNKLIGAGNKSDDQDAETLARLLRLGELKAVYKGDGQQQQLRELFRAYDNLVEDATRLQNRLKSLYRGRGIDCAGHHLLRQDQREQWLAKLPEAAARFRAESLLKELDLVQQLRKEAKSRFLAECKPAADYAVLLKLPGIGPVRAASLMAIVICPARFRTKRQFWPYCGFAVVTHSSADYVEVGGRIVKQQKKAATRGLNRNHHPRLKAIFKGAALSVLRDQDWRAYYDGLVANGTKPELARISVARKLAAITLAVWQRREEYDPKKVFATA
jgi:transposase